MSKIRISDSTFSFVLLLSFIPFMIKSVSYIEAGNYVPFFVMDFIGLPLVYGFYKGKSWVISWLKAWAIIMMVFGVLRLALALMVSLTDMGIEAYITDQIGPGFFTLCAAYIVGGFYLIRKTGSALVIAD